MDSLSRFLIFSETFRPKRGVFPISTGVFRSHSPALLTHAGRREEKGKECRDRVAFGSQGVRIIDARSSIGRKTRSSCKIISPLSHRPLHLFSIALRGSVLHPNLRILLLALPLSGVHALRILRAPASAVFRFFLHLFTRLR